MKRKTLTTLILTIISLMLMSCKQGIQMKFKAEWYLNYLKLKEVPRFKPRLFKENLKISNKH